jgi:hypothetical protein
MSVPLCALSYRVIYYYSCQSRMLVTATEQICYYHLWNVSYRHSTDLPCYTSLTLCGEYLQKSCLLVASSVGYRPSSRARESVSRSLPVSAAASCVLTLNQDALCIVCLSAVVCSLQCLLGRQSYMHHRR